MMIMVLIIMMMVLIIMMMVLMRIIMRTMNFSETRMTFEKLPDLKLRERENQFGTNLESYSLFSGTNPSVLRTHLERHSGEKSRK